MALLRHPQHRHPQRHSTCVHGSPPPLTICCLGALIHCCFAALLATPSGFSQTPEPPRITAGATPTKDGALHHLSGLRLTLSSSSHPHSTLEVGEVQVWGTGELLLDGGFQWQGLSKNMAEEGAEQESLFRVAGKAISFQISGEQLSLKLPATGLIPGSSQGVEEKKVPLINSPVDELHVSGNLVVRAGAASLQAASLSYVSSTQTLAMPGAVQLALGKHVLLLSQGFFLEAGEAERWIKAVRFLWPF